MSSHPRIKSFPKFTGSIALVSVLVLALCTGLFPMSGCKGDNDPDINKRYPVGDGVLSPPMVYSPIHQCAEAVHVYGFIPHAHIRVYANGNELVGETETEYGFTDVALTRSLDIGEAISATQTVDGATSVRTHHPAVVSPYPTIADGFQKPDVGDNLYDCGRIVPVGHLVESLRVHVMSDGHEVGQSETMGTWKPVCVQPLQEGAKITAVQVACEDDPDDKLASPESDPVTVKAAPDPVPAPVVSTSGLVAGNDKVTVGNLLVGARVKVFDHGDPIGGGYATGSGNWVHIDPPLAASSSITATQELCGSTSPGSPPQTPTTELPPPTLLEPICRGQRHVVLRDVVVNATVVVLRNGSIVGYGGGGPGDLVLALGNDLQFEAGDEVTARQYFGNIVMSPASNTVVVLGGLHSPGVEILGGHPFFLAEEGEKQINGPVFPRGAGSGPLITVQSCCDDPIRVEIHDPGRNRVIEIQMQEIFPGYHRGRWTWESESDWHVPNEIPVGMYRVLVKSGCDLMEVQRPFFVIYDPQDVDGPPRYAFNETGIWFGTGSNSLRALHYYLHPDDARVFNLALDAIQGDVDPYGSARKIADVEEAEFEYSLSYHGNDVLNMLENESKAQCADDANVLTALLRAVGIPAHPATADAALETGDANWTFDTWTEYLVPSGGVPTWLILHPHEYPSMSPRTRSSFGSMPVATKAFNDLIVFADTNWDWAETGDQSSDVTYKRNSCDEPVQGISKKSWVYEACEEYWSPNTHWACASRSSSRLTSALRLDLGDFALGRSLAGTFTPPRFGPGDRPDGFTVELAFDRPESKQFPDSVVSVTRLEIADPDDTLDRPFRFRVPRTTPAGMDLVVIARAGDRLLDLEWLRPERMLSVDLSWSPPSRSGDIRRLDVVVTNLTKRVINDVAVSVAAPLGVDIAKSDGLRVDLLQPGATRTFTFETRFLTPFEAGSISIMVSSADGGWAGAEATFSIPDERLITVESGVMRED